MSDTIEEYVVFDPRAVNKTAQGDNGLIRPPTSELVILDPLSWHGASIPERRWVVPNLIPDGVVTILGGDGGLGKTLLGQHLLTACAVGAPWLGRDTSCRKALGVFCEDDPDELHRRQAAINREYEIDFADLGDMLFTSRVGEDNVLVEFSGGWDGKGRVTDFYHHILEFAHTHGAGLVLLDSLHDLFAGNENSRPQARAFVNALRRIALEIDGAVVLTAHPSMSGLSSGSGSAGSTAWNNAVRSRLYLTRPDGEFADDDVRVLTTKKANYGPIGTEIRIRYLQGVFVPIEQGSGLSHWLGVQTKFVELLDDRERQGRPVSDNKHASNYAPREFAKHPKKEGFNKREFEAAMEALFNNGRIEITEYGRSGDRRKKIVRAGGENDG